MKSKKRQIEFPSSKRLGSKRIKFSEKINPCLKCKKKECEEKGWLCLSCGVDQAYAFGKFESHFSNEDSTTDQSTKPKIRKSTSVQAYFKSSKNKKEIKLFQIDELDEMPKISQSQ